MANLDVPSQVRRSATQRELGHNSGALRSKVSTVIQRWSLKKSILTRIYFLFFQRCAEWFVAADRRARSGPRGGALRLPGAQDPDRSEPPELRPEDLRVRSGANAVLRAGPALPAQHPAHLRPRRRRGLRRPAGFRHRLGKALWR